MPAENTMANQKIRTFVLGAGFTKAFAPDAPTLVDDYGIDDLIAKYDKIGNVNLILETEKSRYGNGKIDLERLMTRLTVGAPFYVQDYSNEQNIVLNYLLQRFIDKINSARNMSEQNETDLLKFAKYCINNHVNCITFNYDDIFDFALNNASIQLARGSDGFWPKNSKGWCPEGGYGFFCKPADSFLGYHKGDLFFRQTYMLLLKLHGSINWFPVIGSEEPYRLGDIFHNSNYINSPHDENILLRIKLHLKPIPFIIPPILDKKSVYSNQILSLIWKLAFSELAGSNEIVFIGYSMPKTDILANFMFSESLHPIHNSGNRKVIIVNKTEDGKQIQQIKESYNSIFDGKCTIEFHYDGALEWLNKEGII